MARTTYQIVIKTSRDLKPKEIKQLRTHIKDILERPLQKDLSQELYRGLIINHQASNEAADSLYVASATVTDSASLHPDADTETLPNSPPASQLGMSSDNYSTPGSWGFEGVGSQFTNSNTAAFPTPHELEDPHDPAAQPGRRRNHGHPR